MATLRETMQNFQNYVLNKNAAIEAQIVGLTPGFIYTRLDVYQEGYYLRLLEILENAFPALRILLGEDEFDKIGRSYIKAYPSQHFSIRYFGQQFTQFLTTCNLEPYLIEMSVFEWALEGVIDAPDAPQLTFEEMTQVPPELWGQLKFTPHPSMLILSFEYNIPKAWQAIAHNENEHEQACDGNHEYVCDHDHHEHEHEEIQIERYDEPCYWLLWRYNLQSLFAPLTKPQHWMMQMIQQNKNFAEICEGLCEWMSEENTPQFAATTLRDWIVEGVFSKFECSPAPFASVQDNSVCI